MMYWGPGQKEQENLGEKREESGAYRSITWNVGKPGSSGVRILYT